MDIINRQISNSLIENENQLKIWTDYLEKHQKLQLNAYQDRLKVPVLVPVGSRILFRGELIHTNEVTVSLGAGYFAKCSTEQAKLIRDRRIAVAIERQKNYEKEKEYLQNQISFSNENVFSAVGKEIIEPFDEDEENLWREKHRENVRNYYQTKKNNKSADHDDTNIWERLDELELKEDFEDMEKEKSATEESDGSATDSDDNESEDDTTLSKNNDESSEKHLQSNQLDNNKTEEVEDKKEVVANREVELRQKLIDLTSKSNKVQYTTEEEIFRRLDELEELEEIEDELDRLEDSESTDENFSGEYNTLNENRLSKRVTFSDEVKVVEINFSHSDVEPCTDAYDGTIKNPNDIYAAFPECFNKANQEHIVPILKNLHKVKEESHITYSTLDEMEEDEDYVPPRKFVPVNVIGSVVEHSQDDGMTLDLQETSKKMSKFKAMRLAKKMSQQNT